MALHSGWPRDPMPCEVFPWSGHLYINHCRLTFPLWVLGLAIWSCQWRGPQAFLDFLGHTSGTDSCVPQLQRTHIGSLGDSIEASPIGLGVVNRSSTLSLGRWEGSQHRNRLPRSFPESWTTQSIIPSTGWIAYQFQSPPLKLHALVCLRSHSGLWYSLYVGALKKIPSLTFLSSEYL